MSGVSWRKALGRFLLGVGLAAVAVVGSEASAAAAGGPAFTTHYVRPGDTIWKLSQRYGVPIADIAELNRLPSPDVVWAGTYLAIPNIARYDIYTVQPGDTLYLIAKAYGLPAATLQKANALRGDLIVPEQRLIIPLGESPAPAKKGPSTGGSTAPTASPVSFSVSDDELRLLAQMIEAEASGEPYVGKVAVGAVILNRVKSPLFPDTIEGVIFEPYQFEPILNGWFWREPSAESWQAARDALNGWDPTGGALYFWNPSKSGYQPFLESRPSAGWIGSHRFAY